MNRHDLGKQFSTPSEAIWKTLVLEAHPGEGAAREYLSDVFGKKQVRPTEDACLHHVDLGNDVSFTVDDLDGRFWSFHSRSPAQKVKRVVLAKVAERRDLDFVWLPTQHLQQIRPDNRPSFVKADFKGAAARSAEDTQDLSIAVRGRDASRLLEAIRESKSHSHAFSVDKVTIPIRDDHFGFVEQAVSRRAYFAVRGDSFELHQQIVAEVISRYRAFVEAVEARTIRFESLGDSGGGTVSGGPIEISFSRPLPSVSVLFDELFSSRGPYRLWGLQQSDEHYGECDLVDLHVGGCLRVEAQQQFLRVHVYDGTCGNTVARLVSNLQHRVDGSLRIVDPELDALLRVDQQLQTA